MSTHFRKRSTKDVEMQRGAEGESADVTQARPTQELERDVPGTDARQGSVAPKTFLIKTRRLQREETREKERGGGGVGGGWR